MVGLTVRMSDQEELRCRKDHRVGLFYPERIWKLDIVAVSTELCERNCDFELKC